MGVPADAWKGILLPAAGFILGIIIISLSGS